MIGIGGLRQCSRLVTAACAVAMGGRCGRGVQGEGSCTRFRMAQESPAISVQQQLQ